MPFHFVVLASEMGWRVWVKCRRVILFCVCFFCQLPHASWGMVAASGTRCVYV